MSRARSIWLGLLVSVAALHDGERAGDRAKKPNVVVLMADDVGSYDIGALGGGVALGPSRPPNIDRLAKEGALFSSWYGQASCTAGRTTFQTGRIPIRSALSVVVVPGDRNGLQEGDADDCLPGRRV